jgi:hypothetical protein
MRTKLLVLFTMLFGTSIVHTASANNMLVQNVTTTGNNATNQTIQVQFDISWDNSWRDAINWDAAWIFIKFKDANGLWQHAQLNQTGFTNGSGTANTVQVTSDKVGCWLYRSALGSGTFNTTGMQLQWNYGLSGLTNVTGLEVRVFAVEMVYVPEGDYTIANNFRINSILLNAPGNNFPVINNRLSPNLFYSYNTDFDTIRIKGDAGIDTTNDGTIDVTSYPIGSNPFYLYRYDLSEQQYADFLNTLTNTQISNVGVAGVNISLIGDQYFSSTPNLTCINATEINFFAYADWSGMRPISFFEYNKASLGPIAPVNFGFLNNGSALFTRPFFGGPPPPVSFVDPGIYYGLSHEESYYGILLPIIKLNKYSFNNLNGNGSLNYSGATDISNWIGNNAYFLDGGNLGLFDKIGFRYCRSAE